MAAAETESVGGVPGSDEEILALFTDLGLAREHKGKWEVPPGVTVCNVDFGKDGIKKPGTELAARVSNSNVPNVKFDTVEDKKYTVVMTDPDAPSRADPKWREFLHYIKVDIAGGESFKTGKTLVEWVGSGCPEGTKYHRYIFLVFEQDVGDKKFKQAPIGYKMEGRAQWKVKDFVENEGGLKLIAYNYYITQNEGGDTENAQIIKKLYEDLGTGTDTQSKNKTDGDRVKVAAATTAAAE